MMSFTLYLIVLFGFWLLITFNSSASRKQLIYKKYRKTEEAEKIIKQVIWVGETKTQLLDSLGKPVDIDEEVLKTKANQIWKYHKKSTKRYGLKIKLENGIVTGWNENLE